MGVLFLKEAHAIHRDEDKENTSYTSSGQVVSGSKHCEISLLCASKPLCYFIRVLPRKGLGRLFIKPKIYVTQTQKFKKKINSPL